MKKDKQGCDMQTCLVCRLCVKEWKPAITHERKNFALKKGAQLFKEGDPVKGVFFLHTGRVKVHKHWGEEKELIVRFAKEGDIVGHRGIGAELVYPVTATVLEAATVCYFELDFFQASLKVNEGLMYEMMMFYARELQESEKKMRNLAHMPVKGRIAYALLSLRDKFGRNEGGFIDFSLSRQDLASYIGATYETTFRMLNELIQENLIILSGKDIAIAQEEKLRALTLAS
ncbi:Crp/Fnr family transcriptional regulator [Chitinophaga niabensis]|uniref:cAMP-binding domain of CRP or a regulatory subunit of cAMP-dependent protein kinases n=1 Tax=Chitinophaga niabensis TaxID=536979 RepID=A0A1N6G554_9BACT|nr:Crp/Fnr family transcriptional regulator [Chitinophaga niabensis]SIO02640.1 cAMP-binding domain of CRP or a regulatory subunit of cAMP-dependent protein kinases [Chitinophaga niabensis]